MHESKYSGSDYFYVLWLCVKAYTGKELTHQNTQGLNILYMEKFILCGAYDLLLKK